MSGTSPSPPIACQDTLLGLTSTSARQGSDGSAAAAASTPSAPRETAIATTRPPSTSGRSASRRTAAAKRSSGTDAIAAAASSSLIQQAASAANPRAASVSARPTWDANPPSEPPKQATAGQPPSGAGPGGSTSRPRGRSTRRAPRRAPATPATARPCAGSRRPTPPLDVTPRTVTRHGSDGGTKSSGVTSGSTKRIAAIGASSAGADQSPVGRCGRGEVEHARPGAVNRGPARQARPNRSSPRPRRAPRPRRRRPARPRGTARRACSSRETSSANGGRRDIGRARPLHGGPRRSGRLPLSTSADRFSNHGGKSPDAKPPTRGRRRAAPSSRGSRAGRRHRGASRRRRRRAGSPTRPSSPRTPRPTARSCRG